ncbi:MAG: 2-oxo acid dehydrogenase subunit E2, partial [Pseudolysinimonas sp.]
MSSPVTGTVPEDGNSGEFGANEWLVDEMYERYLVDKNSVDQSWWPILEAYHPITDQPVNAPVVEPVETRAIPMVEPVEIIAAPTSDPTPTVETPIIARTTSAPAKPQPIPAEAPQTASTPIVEGEQPTEADDVVTNLKGMSKTLATNMDASLTVPTATSVRTVPAKLMIDNRIVINNHLKRARGGKVSFTHLIAWAMVKVLKDFPSQNVFYDEPDGKPSVVAPAHINLGIAIDLPKPDGTRSLLVPAIKRADTMTFAEFLNAYEDVVSRARNNKLTAADFQGVTISLTNPGGIG